MRHHVYAILTMFLLGLPACPELIGAGLLLGSAVCDPKIEICCPGGAGHCAEANKVNCFKPGGVCCRFCKEPCNPRAPR